jgi:hypothetical protein
VFDAAPSWQREFRLCAGGSKAHSSSVICCRTLFLGSLKLADLDRLLASLPGSEERASASPSRIAGRSVCCPAGHLGGFLSEYKRLTGPLTIIVNFHSQNFTRFKMTLGKTFATNKRLNYLCPADLIRSSTWTSSE